MTNLKKFDWFTGCYRRALSNPHALSREQQGKLWRVGNGFVVKGVPRRRVKRGTK